MKFAFQIALLATTVLALHGAMGQTDDVFLCMRRESEGPVGPMGSNGLPGSCICNSTEVEQLNAQVQTLTGLSTLTK